MIGYSVSDYSYFAFNNFLLKIYNKRFGMQKSMYVFLSFHIVTAYGTENSHKNKAY